MKPSAGACFRWQGLSSVLLPTVSSHADVGFSGSRCGTATFHYHGLSIIMACLSDLSSCSICGTDSTPARVSSCLVLISKEPTAMQEADNGGYIGMQATQTSSLRALRWILGFCAASVWALGLTCRRPMPESGYGFLAL